MKKFYLLLVLAAAFLVLNPSCSKDKQPALSFNPDTVTINHLVKGWELYSWDEEGVRVYSLMAATDRTKNLHEVTTTTLVVPGVENLERLLNRFPQGETLTLLGPGWLSRCWSSGYGDLSLPPEKEIEQIAGYCGQLALVFQVVR